ncbi:MAG: choline monooxygenase [Actinomycetota bacterium]|nr:choline monooxygenase [Actinomycetota bacterium]
MAVTIPTHRYTSDGFAALENDRLWPRAWQLACSVDHVASAGDFHELRIGPISVLVVRGDDLELRAFQNACRHRGSSLCEGTGTGLSQLRCPFHRWSYDLTGRLREVPSRREFGALDNYSDLIPVRVDTWGPLVFVNLDLDAELLHEFLGAVPDDCAWARVDEFRCTAAVSIAAPCNWKTLIDGFSETYHVQGIHREMLAMCDDVNGPQRVWERHGKLQQSYGVSSPRLRERPDDQQVWDAFVEVMGVRVGNYAQADAGTAPDVPAGGTIRTAIAGIVRDRGIEAGHGWFSALDDGQLLDMSQYNLFPNVTVLVFADMMQIVRARPGKTSDDAYMDAFSFERVAPTAERPRVKPIDIELSPDEELPIGLILNQDFANFARSQRGLHQPGLTHFVVSPTEECRIVNLHKNLEEFLGISPSEIATA